MDKTLKIIIVLVLIAAVGVAVVVRRNTSGGENIPDEYKPDQLLGKGLPALVELGFDQCIPCKMMAPMLAITFKAASTHLVHGVLLLVVYGMGHCSVIVAAGTCTEWVQRYMNWNEQSKGAVILRKTCGVLILLGGLYLLFIAP